ncbi:hypothetical protein ILP31_20065 [Pectobacterium punjabense]|uniref:hypothetical protein n=1 Tax=Pectobacterium punjabense TaxID=2108399 RepID=UPI001BFF5C87|nr:hypothetical protein [Pectobacterium punjabense]MBT9186383.1 hypothetical protein [Pectobacterium punjabense]
MNVVISTAFFSLSIVALAWVIYGVFSKPQSKGLKVGKSVLAAWYFLTAGNAMRSVDDFSVGCIMLVVGCMIAFYLSKRTPKPVESNDNDEDRVKREIAALRKLGSSPNSTNSSSNNENKKSSVKNKPRSNKKYSKVIGSGIECIAFSYIDASDNYSFRDVDVKSFDGQYIKGYCHLAGESRTFLLNRIDGDIIVRETGELLDPYKWADSFDSK